METHIINSKSHGVSIDATHTYGTKSFSRVLRSVTRESTESKWHKFECINLAFKQRYDSRKTMIISVLFIRIYKMGQANETHKRKVFKKLNWALLCTANAIIQIWSACWTIKDNYNDATKYSIHNLCRFSLKTNIKWLSALAIIESDRLKMDCVSRNRHRIKTKQFNSPSNLISACFCELWTRGDCHFHNPKHKVKNNWNTNGTTWLEYMPFALGPSSSIPFNCVIIMNVTKINGTQQNKQTEHTPTTNVQYIIVQTLREREGEEKKNWGDNK